MPKIILVPGLLCDATVWQPLQDRLGLKTHVGMALKQATLTEMAADILAQHDGELAVLGHSMGARIAMEMARLCPTRIRKLGLFDTGAHPLRDGEAEKRAEIISFTYANGMQALADRWLPGMVYRKDPALMAQLTQMVLRADPQLHERQINALVNRPNASAILSDIGCPTLLLVGRQDQWSPVSQHQEMLAQIADARLEIIEDAGHFSILEQPDAVAAAVVAFLK